MSSTSTPGPRAQRIAHWCLDHRTLTLVFIILPSLLLAAALPRIEVYSRFADLLPARHPYIETYNRMKQTFGGANVVAMSLKVTGEGDIFTHRTLDKIRYLTDQVDMIPGVNHYQVASIAHNKIRRVRTTAGGTIKSEPVLPLAIPDAADDLKRLREEAFNNDVVFGTYVATDGRAALVVAGFDEERLDYHTIFTRLQALKEKVEADGETRLYVAGEPMLKGWIYHYADELWKIFGVTLGVMVLLLFLHFRSVSGVLIPLLGTVMSCLWGLGFVGWLGFNLDPLILVVPMVISARTASHCVQMMERYHDEIRLGLSREAAVRTSMSELLVPASIGIFTDVAGLLVLTVSSIPLIAKLGYFAAFWSFSNLITVVLLVPLVLSWLPAPAAHKVALHKHVYAQAMATLAVFLTSKRGALPIGLATAVVLALSLVWGRETLIGEEKPGSPILFQDAEYNVSALNIATDFAGASQLSIYFEGDERDRIKHPDVVHLMEDFARFMAQTPGYGGTRDIPSLVRAVNRLYHYDDPRWGLLPLTQNDIGNTLFMYQAGASVPGVITEFMDLDGRVANFVVFFKDATGATIYAAMQAARAYLAEHTVPGVKALFAGGIVGTTAAANEEVATSELRQTCLIIAMVMMAVLVTYRSFNAALLVFAVLALAVMVNRAYMGFRGIGLNVSTLPVTAVGVGLGVDYAIYMLDRIREEVRHRSLDDAIEVALATTGAAVLFTAIAVIAGIAYWVPGSSLRFESEMAMLLSLLTLSHMVGSVTVLPLLIRLTRPAFIMREHIDDSATGDAASRAVRAQAWWGGTP
ncbi:MAG: MMPL family transporter [Gammaproteobacteria bacterium]|nr:MMPL family transporter [Gammaproteobacteria bacterium]